MMTEVFGGGAYVEGGPFRAVFGEVFAYFLGEGGASVLLRGIKTQLGALSPRPEMRSRRLKARYNLGRVLREGMIEPMSSAKARVDMFFDMELRSLRKPSTTRTKMEPEARHPYMIPV